MKKEIDFKSIFGFKYYSKTRIFEKEIETQTEIVDIDFVCLYLLKDKTEVILEEDITLKHIYNLFIFGFYHLIQSNIIQIKLVEDRFSFGFNFLALKKKYYIIEQKNEFDDQDDFCNDILKSINYLKSQNKTGASLKKIVSYFLKRRFKNHILEVYFKPEFTKIYLDACFRQTKMIIRKTNLKNNTSKFILNSDISEEIQNQFFQLKKHHKRLQNSNIEYRKFISSLERIVKKEIYLLTNDDT